ncbi:hypothetical protein CPB86DRAFT_823685 [Serendipita vermifera]|nr:hypothetical protein CPB86DRAFT_823685 [Serendipita vermifera]
MASHVQDIWTRSSMSNPGSGLRSEYYNPPRSALAGPNDKPLQRRTRKAYLGSLHILWAQRLLRHTWLDWIHTGKSGSAIALGYGGLGMVVVPAMGPTCRGAYDSAMCVWSGDMVLLYEKLHDCGGHGMGAWLLSVIMIIMVSSTIMGSKLTPMLSVFNCLHPRTLWLGKLDSDYSGSGRPSIQFFPHIFPWRINISNIIPSVLGIYAKGDDPAATHTATLGNVMRSLVHYMASRRVS